MFPRLTFEAWKSRLKEDCIKNDMLRPYDALGDYVLRLWWEAGTQPTVAAIRGEDVTSDGVGKDS
jgi:hypothetical protein